MNIGDYGKDRETKINEGREVGDLDDQSGGMGTSAKPRIKHGYDQIGASRKNSQGRITDESNDSNGKQFIGKILSELRELREAHLQYVKAHEQRLEARLAENRQYQSEIVNRMNRLEREMIQFVEEQLP